MSCQSGGSGQVASPTEPSPALQQHTVADLLTLYRTALVQQDIDRLDALLQRVPPLAQASARLQPTTRSPVLDAPTFRDTMATLFRTVTITDLQLPAEAIQIALDACCVTFLEVESVADPRALMQQTRLYRTTWALTQDRAGGVITVRIAAVQRDGPLLQVTTRGQVQAGALTRVEVEGSADPFVLTGGEVEVPETGAVQALRADGPRWQGLFTPPAQPGLATLRVRLQGHQGATLVVDHRYWLQGPGAGVVPGATTASVVGQLTQDPAGRVEASVVDQLGRIHFVVFAEGSVAFPPDNKDVVLDRGTFCGTVNAFDPHQAYPFRVRDAQTNTLRLSASTRATAAGGGDIWLFGSDGGVARVADTFRNGQCPTTGVTVHYEPILRREDGGLLTNTVPALVVGADATVWLGTALGLSRWQQGQLTALPFAPGLAVPGNAATLEAFFRAVAQAIFAAQPLSTVALGTVSFLDAFGQPLVKEDLIFSLVVDRQNRLWVGTLGGGLRRLEGATQTLHLTRAEGLGSNLILALAVGPDDTVWAATDEGLSRLREVEGRVTISNISALNQSTGDSYT